MLHLARLLFLAKLMFLCVLAGGCLASEPGITDNEIVLGLSAGFTGPLARMVPDLQNASKAYFDSVNASGGIYGRKIRTLEIDDGYDPARTLKNTEFLVNEEKVFALYSYAGTANVAAVLPMLAANSDPVPLVGPLTGAENVREHHQANIFHVRASYADELNKMVQHLCTLGMVRIAVLWLNNDMGKDSMVSMGKILKKYGIAKYGNAPIEADGSDAAKAVDSLRTDQPQAIIMITTGAATVRFIKRYNQVHKGTKFYALSVMGTSDALHELGPDGIGVVVTSVVPFPWSESNRLSREYRATMKKAGFSNLSFLGFEAYINARIVGEGLIRAGKNPTRAKFIAALESIQTYDMGDFYIGYDHEKHFGSHYVELTMIKSGERFAK